MQRPLQKDDFLFPAIAATGKLKIGTAVGRTEIEKMLDFFSTGAGLLEGRSGKFTTHCFRRGGAQWCFMWRQDRKWSLKAVKWWGGWAPTENVSNRPSYIDVSTEVYLKQVGTLMRYLLDEVSKYEHGYHDMLMPSRSYERHVTFMGDAVTSPARRSCDPKPLFSIPLNSNTSSSLCSALLELSPKKIHPQIQQLFAQAGPMGGLFFIFIPVLSGNLRVTAVHEPETSFDHPPLLQSTVIAALPATAPPTPTKLSGNPFTDLFETPHRSHRPAEGFVFI
jgi:hypothetical protein